MAKKKKDLTQYYRWQFLRLNKKYRRDYDWFIDYSKNLTEDDKRKFNEDVKKDFSEDYGINGIYDYRIKSPPLELRISGEADLPVQKGSLREIFGNNPMIIGNYLVERRNITEENEAKEKGNVICDIPKFVQVIINCDAKEDEIISGIRQIVRRFKKERRYVFGIKGPRKICKNNKESVKDYERYLKIYKWHSNKRSPLSFKKIAQKIYPRYEEEPAIDRIRKAYHRARQLISSEYRKIIL